MLPPASGLLLVLWLARPAIASGAPKARLRYRAQRRKMHATHRQNEAERLMREVAPEGEPAGLSLLPFSVSKKTALTCHVPNVRRFLDFALERNLPMLSRDEIDNSVLTYLGGRGGGAAPGRLRGARPGVRVAGLVYWPPELQPGSEGLAPPLPGGRGRPSAPESP